MNKALNELAKRALIENPEKGIKQIAEEIGAYYSYVYGVAKANGLMRKSRRRSGKAPYSQPFLDACGLFCCKVCNIVKDKALVSLSKVYVCRKCLANREQDRRASLRCASKGLKHKHTGQVERMHDFRDQKAIRRKWRRRLNKVLSQDTSPMCSEYFGCDLETLRTYIASMFQDGMSWSNYSFDTWHIDHIIPLSVFDLTDHFESRMANHYKNMRPMWGAENISKGNRII